MPYEGMFVVFNKEAQKSHDYLEEYVKGLLQKVGASLVRLTKWDERQLAYEIKGQTEGIFYLAYFEAQGNSVKELRREAELSEIILRLLVLRIDSVPAEEDVKGPRRRSEEGEERSGEADAGKPAEGKPVAEAKPATTEPDADQAAEPVAEASAADSTES